MNRRLTRRLASFAFLLVLSGGIASSAEARPGGGFSGSRGSRSFGTRSAPSSPYRHQGQPRQQQPDGFSQQHAQPGGAFGGGGGFMRGMMGGLAGGMIGSMLFGGLGRAGGFGGGGGMGLLDLLLLGGLGFMAFRFFQSRKLAAAGQGHHPGHREMSHLEKLRSVEPGPFAPAEPDSDPAFKDERIDDFMRLQAAWNHGDLSSLSDALAPELRSQLDADLARLKAAGRANRVENIAVRGTELIESWRELGREFATVRFRANLTDYTIEESTGQVVAGDRVQPVKFEEDWTFVRDRGGPWKVTAIEA